MPGDTRLQAIRDLLFKHVQSPSLRHIRDSNELHILANEIMRVVESRDSVWLKWDKRRERLAKSAIGCRIPLADLRDFLNELPGPLPTSKDVAQRTKALEEESAFSYPKEELQAGCLAIYEQEKALRTELPAIIGILRDHVEQEEERLWLEQRERCHRLRAQVRLDEEQRLLSGADCKWTQIPESLNWHCRRNGRLYRLSPTKDKMWNLYSANAVGGSNGSLIGEYKHRRDASKVVAAVAYDSLHPLQRFRRIPRLTDLPSSNSGTIWHTRWASHCRVG